MGAALWWLAASAALAAPDDPLRAAIEEARDMVGIDVARARAQVASLRQRAMAAARLDARLATDEIDCSILRYADAASARDVVAAGLAAVAAAPSAALGDPRIRRELLRLRVCAAGNELGAGQAAAGLAQLEPILAETAGQRDVAAVRALALIERGDQRSVSGELVSAQADLLEACRSLQAVDRPRDTEACLGVLASHYVRMGDLDEARRLFVQLLAGARERGANIDASIHVYELARVDFSLQAWEPALAAYREALAMSEALDDERGIAYAEQGLGGVLIKLDRPAEALPHIQRALTLVAGSDERKIVLRCRLWLASARVALGQIEMAADVLRRTEADVRASQSDALVADWLSSQRQVHAALGRWREAFEVAEEARRTEARVQAQRLSEQTARLRMGFNREKDEIDLQALQQANAQGQQLRRVQALALVLFGGLLLVLLFYAHYKFRQGRVLKALALNDELTGLANRRAVLAQAERRLVDVRRLGQRLGLLMIDVDRFKLINDGHGHGVGDEVLRHLARVLTADLRTHDHLGRLGGEEFLVVLPDVQGGAAAAIAERMRQSVAAAPCAASVGPLAFTISIGVAEAEAGDDTQTVKALLERADAALYAAKARGRNAVVLADELVTVTAP